MKLGEFIRKYREDHGLSQRQFAIKCGISNGYVSMLEAGVNPSTGKPIVPKLQQLYAMCKGMNISMAQLSGLVDDVPIDITPTDIQLPDNILPLPQFKKIPLLGDIACGEPILAEQNIEDYFKCPENIDADFCLRCKGDSMIGARIHDGDIVYIRQQPTVENGKIAAVLIDNEATLKRVFIEKDRVILQPENSAYSPLIFIKEEMNQVRIIGKAVCFISKVK